MRLTQHAIQRMRQRQIPEEVIELALAEGKPLSRNQDRILLSAKRVDELRHDESIDLAVVARAARVAPIVCVLVRDILVTAFRPRRSINYVR